MDSGSKPSQKVYFISEVAKEIGLNPKTIRYYEEIGILPRPKRHSNDLSVGPGYRTYTEVALERMRFVKFIRHLGLSLTETKGLLKAIDSGCCGSARPKFSKMIDEKLGQIDAQMRDLEQLSTQLQEMKRAIAKLPNLKIQQSSACPSKEGPSKCATGKEMGEKAKGRTNNAGAKPR